MASLDTRIITFNDLLSHLIRVEMSGARTKSQEEVKEAVQSAYTNVCLKYRWNFYNKEYRLQMSAPYETGTVVYDHTGGASERLITLTSGTFPDWAQYGRIRIGTNVHDVATRESDTTLTLHENINPGADVSSSAYSLYRSTYPFPEDMLSLEEIVLENSVWRTYYIEPTDWLRRERFLRANGQPWVWTMMENPDKTTEFAMFVDPPPDTAEPLTFIYRRRPRMIRWAGIEQAAHNYTLSGSAAAGTLTTNNALPATMVGSILRIAGLADTTDEPTGLGGFNTFIEQHRIKSLNTVTVTLDGTTLSQAYSAGTSFVVSDPVDASFTMIEAIKAESRALLAEMHGKVEVYQMRRDAADKAIRVAMENEPRANRRTIRGSTPYDYFHSSNFRIDTDSP